MLTEFVAHIILSNLVERLDDVEHAIENDVDLSYLFEKYILPLLNADMLRKTYRKNASMLSDDRVMKWLCKQNQEVYSTIMTTEGGLEWFTANLAAIRRLLEKDGV